MAVIDVFPPRIMRHNDQKDNEGSHGIGAGSDCWYTSGAMAGGFIGFLEGDDRAVFRIKEEMEGDGHRSLLHDFLRDAKYGDHIQKPGRLAIMGEMGALYLALKGREFGFRVVWAPGYRHLAAVEQIAKANNLPLIVQPDSDGSILARGLRRGQPAVLSTMATPSGHYVTASGVWEDSGAAGGLRIEDPHGRYPYSYVRVGDGAGNLHTWDTLRKMRGGLGWRYAQLVPNR